MIKVPKQLLSRSSTAMNLPKNITPLISATEKTEEC